MIWTITAKDIQFGVETHQFDEWDALTLPEEVKRCLSLIPDYRLRQLSADLKNIDNDYPALASDICRAAMAKICPWSVEAAAGMRGYAVTLSAP